MAFIKEESEDLKIEDTFRVKHEDAEQITGWLSFSQIYRSTVVQKDFEDCHMSVDAKICGYEIQTVDVLQFQIQ